MIGAATLLVATALMAIGVARERLRDIELTISRALLYRSVVVSVLGVYLLAVGVLGWLLNYLRDPGAGVLGLARHLRLGALLALVLLSDRVRWRIKRFVELNLYRSKYDYREHWVAFTKRMASLVTVDELGPQLLEALTEAVGSTRAALYLADAHGEPVSGGGDASACRRSTGGVGADAPLVARLREARDPIVLDGGADPALPADLAGSFGEGSVALPARLARDADRVHPPRPGAHRAGVRTGGPPLHGDDRGAGGGLDRHRPHVGGARAHPGVRRLQPPHLVRDPRRQELGLRAVPPGPQRPDLLRRPRVPAGQHPDPLPHGRADDEAAREAGVAREGRRAGLRAGRSRRAGRRGRAGPCAPMRGSRC